MTKLIDLEKYIEGLSDVEKELFIQMVKTLMLAHQNDDFLELSLLINNFLMDKINERHKN